MWLGYGEEMDQVQKEERVAFEWNTGRSSTATEGKEEKTGTNAQRQ